MGGGLSRVADTSELVPVAYENVANLQRQMDSYMPAAVAIITAPANRRSSKRRSTKGLWRGLCCNGQCLPVPVCGLLYAVRTAFGRLVECSRANCA